MSVVLKSDTREWVLDQAYEINRVELRRAEPLHTHQFFEIVYTYQGKGLHIIDDREYLTRHGDLLFIDYHSRHFVEPQGQLMYVDIMLKPEYVSEALRGTEDARLLLEVHDFSDFKGKATLRNSLIHFDGEEQHRLESLIEWTEEEQKKNAPGGNLMKRSALQLLLSLIFRKMAEAGTERISVNDALLSYIEQNCAQNLRQDAFAAKCFYTTAHFSRAFKKYTGRTFTQYLCDCRINKAKHLLRATERPVEQILLECGFSNRTAFFKHFSQSVGCSPLQYRKNQK